MTRQREAIGAIAELEQIAVDEYKAAVRDEKTAEAYEAEAQTARASQREHARACGEALILLKQGKPHGTWLPWLESAGIPERTARMYMEMVRTDRETVDRSRSESAANPNAADLTADEFEQLVESQGGVLTPEQRELWAQGKLPVQQSCFNPEFLAQDLAASFDRVIEAAQEHDAFTWVLTAVKPIINKLNKQIQKGFGQ